MPISLTASKRLALGSGNLVLVANADEIVAFDLTGNFLHTFGRPVLKNPADLCVANDRIFVVDPGLKEIVIFRNPGSLEGRFGLPPISGQAFAEPVAVAVWKDRIYVLDKQRCTNRCVLLEVIRKVLLSQWLAVSGEGYPELPF